jgi:threonine aldolase
MLTRDEIASALHLGGPYYSSRTALICLENTHNFGGGSVMAAGECAEICRQAHELNLPVHMDGARIFNASIALATPVADLTRECDSVQFSLSKGLGAPVGGILLGSKAFIDEAKIWRKRLGGGMRQIGILGAAGLIALEEGPKRLHEDHANARRLADGLASIDGIHVGDVVTNIVIFNIAGTGMKYNEITDALDREGVRALGFDESIRMVTHLNVAPAEIEFTIEKMREICSG